MIALLVTVVGMPGSASGQGVSRSARVDSLLQQMTLEEKLTFLHGERDPEGEAGAGYMPGVPRLGIPPLRLSDGPAGVRTRRPATALPAPVALASTFDPTLAQAYGRVLGREGRARGQDVLLAPMVNIVRVPHAGRNFETLSEDPLLSARMVAEEVRGVQEAGLIATVKHYVANNFERGRTTASADVSDRALHEIYLPGFEAAVRAGAGAVMCSYNRVNGVYACDHPQLLNEILRGEFGFGGWVMTDWGAAHTLAALEHGLDQEMPGGRGSSRQPVYFGDSLRAAVEEGRIPAEWVDRAVGRILGEMEAVGLLDGSAEARPPIDEAAGAELALEVAKAGAVLLRNEGGLLPLSAGTLGSVLVVGPTAQTPLVGGGGSSRVPPLHTVGFLEALSRRTGPGSQVSFLPGMDLEGVPVPTSALAPPAGTGGAGSGLLRFGPEGAALGVDSVVDFTGAGALRGGAEQRWEGVLRVPRTGEYRIHVHTAGGRAVLSLDGDEVVRTGRFGGGSLLPTAAGLVNSGVTLTLEEGRSYELSLRALPSVAGSAPGGGGGEPVMQLRLAWVTPDRREALIAEAEAAAREAAAVIVFAHQEGTEGADRTSLSLPDPQDELISRVARANAQTAVVLNTGAAVLMPWIEEVASVLEVWYGGEEGGEAAAALLLGEANPRGKLPVTFPRTERGHATGEERRYPGVGGRVLYEEGVFVGYRWFDAFGAAQGVAPLYPFGHGLSYTTFTFSDLEVRPAKEGFVVEFTLTNTGSRAGVEVAQLYLGPPDDPPVPMPPLALADFQAVELAPGAQRRISLSVGERALSYWSEAEDRWVHATGPRPIYVGASSRDLRLRGVLGGAPGG